MASSNFQVSCSFCEEEFMSEKALINHLMMCGNKTDQCPNCKKYVRRAIFAYHYENNCANPDAPSTEEEGIQQTAQPRKILVSIKCEYCKQNYDRADRQAHRENCLRKPLNQRKFTDEKFNQSSDESHQSDDTDDDACISCEWCHQEVSLHYYERHAKACRDGERKRLEEKQRRGSKELTPASPTIGSSVVSAVFSFPIYVFYGLRRSLQGFSYHQVK